MTRCPICKSEAAEIDRGLFDGIGVDCRFQNKRPHEQNCSDCCRPRAQAPQLRGVSLSGGWQCQNPISSGNMPKRPCFGPPSPKTEEEKQLLLELVCTWTQVAVVSERTLAGPTIHEPSKDIGLAAGA